MEGKGGQTDGWWPEEREVEVSSTQRNFYQYNLSYRAGQKKNYGVVPPMFIEQIHIAAFNFHHHDPSRTDAVVQAVPRSTMRVSPLQGWRVCIQKLPPTARSLESFLENLVGMRVA